MSKNEQYYEEQYTRLIYENAELKDKVFKYEHSASSTFTMLFLGVFLSLILYGIISFINWELNPALWGGVSRFFCIGSLLFTWLPIKLN